LSRPTVLFITRHGQTDANLEKRVQGQGDTPLNTTGLAQAGDLADYFLAHAIDRIVCSDLIRARQTAQVLVDALDVPVSYHPELRARRMGSFENKTHAELEVADPEAFRRLKHDSNFVPPDGGESVTELKARMVPFVRQVAHQYAGQRVAILSHHKICQLILAELAGGDMRPIPNARPALVEYKEQRFHLVEEDVAHGTA